MSSFGGNIKKFRLDNGLTQQDFADALMKKIKRDFDISGKSVSKWENGEATPSVKILIAISRLLKISIDDLLSAEIEAFDNENKPLQNECNFEKLTDHEMDFLYGIMESLSARKLTSTDGQVTAVFYYGYISIDSSKSNDMFKLVINEKPFVFEKDLTVSDYNYDDIEKWLKDDVLKSYYSCGIISDCEIFDACSSDTEEQIGFVAEVTLHLSETELEEFFLEHCRRKVAVKIYDVKQRAEREFLGEVPIRIKSNSGGGENELF